MRILAALSGGVDSAVAAARLQRDGAEVIGVHLRTGVEAEGESAGGTRSCCGADDARDARRIAAHLDVPFYVVDVQEAFAGVRSAFVDDYANGRTPNPCILCNRDVKFGRLREIAAELGCEAVATGHYARRELGTNGRHRLLQGIDPQKDQSYVLYPLDQVQLAAARFPLGATVKGEIRVEAAKLGLEVAAKPDSQDLCFLPHGDVGRYLREHAPEALRPGPILDAEAGGREIGTHGGAAAFTIGQRRGLPAVGSPRYVTRVDPATGRVEVGSRERALERDVDVGALNWIDEPPLAPGARRRVEARIRHASAPAPAELEVRPGGMVRVRFDEPAFAPTPGQALVAYRGDAVLCGGTILSGASGLAGP